MSEVKDPNGMPDTTADGGDLESQQSVNDTSNDTVKYETFSKVMSRLKKVESALEQERAEKVSLQQDKLSVEGKKDELIESLRRQNQELDGKYKSAVGSFAKGKALDAIVDQAVKAGCTSTTLLRKAVEDKIGELEFDDQFNPNQDQTKLLVDQLMRDEPVLFSKEPPKIASHQINPSSGQTVSDNKSLNKMTEDELAAAFANSFKS